jgi:hypothetical protein
VNRFTNIDGAPTELDVGFQPSLFGTDWYLSVFPALPSLRAGLFSFAPSALADWRPETRGAGFCIKAHRAWKKFPEAASLQSAGM